MGKVINCECGEVTRGKTDEELLDRVKEHITLVHPELLEKLTPEDILAMAEEDD